MKLVGQVTRQIAIRKSCPVFFIWLCCAAGRSSAQQTVDLQQQLQQLKQEYQQKIEELDQRLAALEKQRATPAPAQAAPQPNEAQQSTSQNVTAALGNAVGQGLKTA